MDQPPKAGMYNHMALRLPPGCTTYPVIESNDIEKELEAMIAKIQYEEKAENEVVDTYKNQYKCSK